MSDSSPSFENFSLVAHDPKTSENAARNSRFQAVSAALDMIRAAQLGGSEVSLDTHMTQLAAYADVIEAACASRKK